MSIVVPNTSQANTIDLAGLGTQLAINVGIAAGTICAFNILRPNNSLVYAPKYKYSDSRKQPPKIGRGFFDWILPVLTAKEDELVEKLGYDAVLFIRFIRLLRNCTFIMTIVGVFGVMPLNLVGTYYTGDWPPNFLTDISCISIAGINTKSGQFLRSGDNSWFWGHVAATWLVSMVVYLFCNREYQHYVEFRRHWFQSEEYQSSMHARTLAVLNVPHAMQSDERLGGWFKSLGPRFPIHQASIGRKVDKLPELLEQQEQAVRNLEIALAQYLGDGKVASKRPRAKVGGMMGCGGRSVDAIDYYTQQMQDLEDQINEVRQRIGSFKQTNYGWVSFSRPSWAAAVAKQFSSELAITKASKSVDPPLIFLAPQPKDIIWKNFGLPKSVRSGMRFFWNVIFFLFAVAWLIPLTCLQALAQLKRVYQIFPNSQAYFTAHPFAATILTSWFAPIVLTLFVFVLPMILRIFSVRQGTLTTTSLDRQVLSKLYVFFIVNNLLYFTISGIAVSIYGQIKDSINNGLLTPQDVWNNAQGLVNTFANSVVDTSNFWVTYTCVRELGIVIDLAQIVSLLIIFMRKRFTHPSPRQIKEFTRPPAFDYPVYYNGLLFFFTVGLVYSVIAPIVLPFVLVYFLISTLVCRYLLMYIFTTRLETGGQMWRVLFNRLMSSAVIFQIAMIGVLYIKGGSTQSYAVIPLPFVTLAFKYICYKTYDPKAYFYLTDDSDETSPMVKFEHTADKRERLGFNYGHPALFAELATPMVHANIQHLLPQVYRGRFHNLTQTVTSALTRKKTQKHLTTVGGVGDHDIKFHAVEEEELEVDDDMEGLNAVYKFGEGPAQALANEKNVNFASPESFPSTPMMDETTGAMGYPVHETYTDQSTKTPLINKRFSPPIQPDLGMENYIERGRYDPHSEVYEMGRLHQSNLSRVPVDHAESFSAGPMDTHSHPASPPRHQRQTSSSSPLNDRRAYGGGYF
ncbi:hypothetical protein BZG36_02718 [Bifiguratus adelaidae]|uniref:CSC1/OSCA1-like 7TM region domain-containing protein n=1 Tax=Bifiguratus adelaidae TaxID=1938954 RepID=A0A261Y1R4_9FUNG|nr:hypothetical protein BZG36_02718 [Bifiguratus adelaidae]